MRRFKRRAAGVLLAVGLIAAPAPAGAAEQVPELVERAELQRLLTQRIARAYCQAGLGVAPAGSGQELLESVALQWMWLETALEQEGPADYGLVVADSTDAITRGMQAVTRLYQGKPDAASQPLPGLARSGYRPATGYATLARGP